MGRGGVFVMFCRSSRHCHQREKIIGGWSTGGLILVRASEKVCWLERSRPLLNVSHRFGSDGFWLPAYDG